MATEKKTAEKRVSRDLQSVARQLVAFDETKKKAEKRRQEWEERKRRQLEEERRLRQKAKESEKGIYMKAVIASGFINEYPGEYALLAGMIIDGMRIIKEGKEGEEYRQAYIELFKKRIAELSQPVEEDENKDKTGSKKEEKEEKQDQAVAEETEAGDSSAGSGDTDEDVESESEDADTAESDVEEDKDSSESSSNGTSWDGNNYGNIGF